MSLELIEETFSLTSGDYKKTSDETPDYNCFAYVVGDENQWWSPTKRRGYYWPPNIPRTLDVGNFCQLYNLTAGYVPCNDTNYEDGFEKIALYANDIGEITHVAKQKDETVWVSKLGEWEDIEHQLESLEGIDYGKVVQILKRPV